MLVALDSSVVHCFVFKKASGQLRCFVLDVSGDRITNADDAVDNRGQIFTEDMQVNDADFGVDRAAGTNTFVICWQVNSNRHLNCALFSVSGGAVHEVGSAVHSTIPVGGQHPENPAVAGLSGTSAVVCSSESIYSIVTQCASMSWTAGNLNSLVFTAHAAIATKSYWRTMNRLSDSKALLCYASFETDDRFQECSIVTRTETGTSMHMAAQFKNPDIANTAWDQRTVALGPNKAVTTYSSRRRLHKIYTLAMDIDEQTGTVTQNGNELEIGVHNAKTSTVGALGPDRAFSVYHKYEGAGNYPLYAVPEW